MPDETPTDILQFRAYVAQKKIEIVYLEKALAALEGTYVPVSLELDALRTANTELTAQVQQMQTPAPSASIQDETLPA